MSRKRRIIKTLAITGATQQVVMDLTIGEVDHLIVTSDTDGHTFTLEIRSEKSDSIWGPTDIATPQNGIRPDLHPIGPMTMIVTNPLPASGTVTFVAILEEN